MYSIHYYNNIHTIHTFKNAFYEIKYKVTSNYFIQKYEKL